MARKSKNRQRSNPAATDVATGAEAENEIEMTCSSDEVEQLDTEPSPFHAGDVEGGSMLDAVASNTKLLEKIQAQLDGLCQGMVSHMNQTSTPGVAAVAAVAPTLESDETSELHDRIFDLEDQIQTLEQKNRDLESQVAAAKTRDNVESIIESDEALSWEDRKQRILQQMEDDSFDSDEFADSLGSQVGDRQAGSGDPVLCDDPVQYIHRLNDELARRDQEISNLQHLLEQQSQTCEAGVSIGAAGIAEMIDSDELVREERERLQQLQTEWEEKFRQSEIEASLERAKLSRERRELAAKQSELEGDLERVRLKLLQLSEKDGPRKWLSQLGLGTT